MSVKNQVQDRIARELELERRFSIEDIEHMIKSGESEATAYRIIFYASPADFLNCAPCARAR